MSELKHLPSIDKLLNLPESIDLIRKYGRRRTLAIMRDTIAEIRASMREGLPLPDQGQILQKISDQLDEKSQSSLVGVINATGVVLHTNLGRAPLGAKILDDIIKITHGYSNLEFDLRKGKRGSRTIHVEDLLIELTGAESALVVNNNAAAVLLCLTAFAKRRSVVISRTQLVEIGGGFRVPDVMKQSGAKLLEIGTTNRVNIQDYREALQQYPVAMVLHAHHSNFKMIGFTTEPALNEVAAVAKENDVLMMDDLGSGALIDTSLFGLAHEPTVQESLEAGVDLVCFSGDKLLGGPQAGIIVGSTILLSKLKKHPLARALRADKLCLAALTATLMQYLQDAHIDEIPIWHMISKKENELKEIAQDWKDKIGIGDVIKGLSTIGGGSLPGENLPSYLLAIPTNKPDEFLQMLRELTPPIIARIENDQVIVDPRTVMPGQDQKIISGLKDVYSRLNH